MQTAQHRNTLQENLTTDLAHALGVSATCFDLRKVSGRHLSEAVPICLAVRLSTSESGGAIWSDPKIGATPSGTAGWDVVDVCFSLPDSHRCVKGFQKS